MGHIVSVTSALRPESDNEELAHGFEEDHKEPSCGHSSKSMRNPERRMESGRLNRVSRWLPQHPTIRSNGHPR
jgi:hypothetical protein